MGEKMTTRTKFPADAIVEYAAGEGMTGASSAQHYIREWRKKADLTVYQLGDRIGMSGSMVAQIERGSSRYTERTLTLLAQGIGCQPWQLIAYPPEHEQIFIEKLGKTDVWEGIADNMVPIADEVYECFVTVGKSLAVSIAKMAVEGAKRKRRGGNGA
jgi:transcriptional regulator with XRE-family HTH domain